MDKQLDRNRALSVHLSHALDDIGLNAKIVHHRRQMALKEERAMTVFSHIELDAVEKKNLLVYFFGSQSEGTTTLGLQSDQDILICDVSYNVIHDMVEAKQNETNLLMLHEDTTPGHCRLQLLPSDAPRPRGDFPDEHYVYDSSKRVIVKNSWLHFDRVSQVRNGPADTIIAKCERYMDLDTVIALRCSAWPPYAEAWVNRTRQGHWPPQRLIQDVLKDGFFVVAAGDKLSQTQDLEWRVSFSLTERRLMFSMNMTQIKCYVSLKMLMKSLVIPYVGDSISSYHCKTTMFYCMEETDSEYWREDNLVECIVKCLRLLYTWVNKEFCPHFIIPAANLFAGKITPQNQHEVKRALKELIENTEQFLLSIPIDDIGNKTGTKLKTPSDQRYVLDPKYSIKIISTVNLNYFKSIYHCRLAVLVEYVKTDRKLLVPHIQKLVYTLSSWGSQPDQFDRFDARDVQPVVDFLSFWLGSLLSSASLSRKKIISQKAQLWLQKGLKPETDVTSLLKLASIFYRTDPRRTENILLDVADEYFGNDVKSLCGCLVYKDIYHISSDFADQVYAADDEDERATLFADCVRFSPQEFRCAPVRLRYEFYRSVGKDMDHRDGDDTWMDLAVVDSLPFLYYLQYITYGRLGKRTKRIEALQNLEKCLVNNNEYGHPETGWNLLGQCMELEEKVEDAMRCYRTSLEIRPRNNAANWHLGILWYQTVQKDKTTDKGICVTEKKNPVCNTIAIPRSISIKEPNHIIRNCPITREPEQEESSPSESYFVKWTAPFLKCNVL